MATRVGTWLWIGSLALACAHCAGEPEGTDFLAEHGPVAMEGFERALAQALCASADRCDLGSFVTSLEEGQCVEAVERYISLAGGARLRAAVGAGQASYDDDATRACIDSFADRCPPRFDLVVNGITPLAWCPEAFVGPCASPLEHKQAWEPPLGRGDHCLAPVDVRTCGAGTACAYASNSCEPCTGDGGASEDLSCQQEPHAALSRIFLEERPEGASCALEDLGVSGACDVGLACEIELGRCEVPVPLCP
jgi:hypothetical protein